MSRLTTEHRLAHVSLSVANKLDDLRQRTDSHDIPPWWDRVSVSRRELENLARALRRRALDTGYNPAQPSLPLHVGKVTEITRNEALFDGETYDPALDDDRLRKQLGRVWQYLRDRSPDWITLAELAAHANGSEASVSARLRDLRKPKFGGYRIERQRRAHGGRGVRWQYRLAPDELRREVTT